MQLPATCQKIVAITCAIEGLFDTLTEGAVRILLVEDHQDTLEAMSRLLTLRNHHVDTATTLADAKGLCKSNGFELMICDIGLPDGDGWELGLLAQKLNIPAIALTAYGMPDDVTRGKEMGFTAYLVKPVDLDKLIQTLELVEKTIIPPPATTVA